MKTTQTTFKNTALSTKSNNRVKKLDYTLKRKDNDNNTRQQPLSTRVKTHNVLNESIMSNISKGTMDLDLETIRELIALMVKHEIKCNEEGKFVQAGLIKDRIEQLRKIEEIKVFDQVQYEHEKQKEGLAFKQDDALKIFNADYDYKTDVLHKDYDAKEKELTLRHKKELELCKEDTINFYPEHPKPSAIIIKKHDTLKNLQKLKWYVVLL